MHGTIAAAEKPPVVKHRTISLTNRAPIRIVEDDWPIVAQGTDGHTEWWGGEEHGFVIQIVFRRHKDSVKRSLYDVSEILHAKYEYSHPERIDEGEYGQKVRIGRILAHYPNVQDGRMKCQSIDEFWQHIRELGAELQERINNVEHRRYVVNAVDKLFAALEPHGL
jgi:hypothetical protein